MFIRPPEDKLKSTNVVSKLNISFFGLWVVFEHTWLVIWQKSQFSKGRNMGITKNLSIFKKNNVWNFNKEDFGLLIKHEHSTPFYLKSRLTSLIINSLIYPLFPHTDPMMPHNSP